ncbi:hypothetical protein PRZ48_000478 [Zasmidium cellare]|uniref:SnoaL-like domain-containing protein n=1 Tax=Zasmidium cellare TaxID=395010 RepID=A0ABR0F0A1_ZASCE|nr:hypothetical protein PRZ48_000478 [Zasmidium cellare]
MSIDQKRKEVAEWLQSWYDVADKCVPPNSVKFFADDCVVRFNNAPAVHGAPAAQKEFESVAPIIGWMKHEILDFDIVDNKIYNECNVTYVLKGDPEEKQITMHRFNFYERNAEGKITKWTAYFDSSPMKERMATIKPGARVY